VQHKTRYSGKAAVRIFSSLIMRPILDHSRSEHDQHGHRRDHLKHDADGCNPSQHREVSHHPVRSFGHQPSRFRQNAKGLASQRSTANDSEAPVRIRLSRNRQDRPRSRLRRKTSDMHRNEPSKADRRGSIPSPSGRGQPGQRCRGNQAYKHDVGRAGGKHQQLVDAVDWKVTRNSRDPAKSKYGEYDHDCRSRGPIEPGIDGQLGAMRSPAGPPVSPSLMSVIVSIPY